jgi:hypothetical protein
VNEYINGFIGFLFVVFFAWLLNTKNGFSRTDLDKEEEDTAPLLGVVLPKKKDETDE